MQLVARLVGFVLYAFLVLAIADWTGVAKVSWPWETGTKTDRWGKEAIEQARLEPEEQKQREAEQRRTEVQLKAQQAADRLEYEAKAWKERLEKQGREQAEEETTRAGQDEAIEDLW